MVIGENGEGLTLARAFGGLAVNPMLYAGVVIGSKALRHKA